MVIGADGIMVSFKQFLKKERNKNYQINLTDNLPDLVEIAKKASCFKETNLLARINRIELRFNSQEELDNFLIQVHKVGLYENKR